MGKSFSIRGNFLSELFYKLLLVKAMFEQLDFMKIILFQSR